MYNKNMLLWPLLVVLSFLLSGCGSEVDLSDLVIRNGIAYQKGGPPFTGDIKGYFPQTEQDKVNKAPRRISEMGAFSEGRKEGTWTTYEWNGEYSVIPYQNGKRHGLAQGFYTNKSLKWDQVYANGMKHGGGAFYDLGTVDKDANGKGDGKVRNGTITKQVFYDRNQLRPPAPKRSDGIDKLSAQDPKVEGPGILQSLFDLFK